MDPLSDVLRSIRLTGGVFLDARFTAPWSITSHMSARDLKPFLASAAQVIAYHVIIEGSLLVAIDGGAPARVSAGEIVLLPRNDTHTMGSSLDLAPVDAHGLVHPSLVDGLVRIEHGGGGEPTRLFCGYLATEDAYNPLFAALPPVLTLDIRAGTARDWVEASVRFAAGELAAGRVASSGVMSRLSELLRVEAVRQYSTTLADGEAGWLRGLRDSQVGRAIALMHGDIAAPWTADGLAREVALSRSAFVERFTSLVGVPPIRYLTSWRLQSARLQLRETSRSVGQLAHAVGYGSEEAFSRAFKREFGLSPARWRTAGAADV